MICDSTPFETCNMRWLSDRTHRTTFQRTSWMYSNSRAVRSPTRNSRYAVARSQYRQPACARTNRMASRSGRGCGVILGDVTRAGPRSITWNSRALRSHEFHAARCTGDRWYICVCTRDTRIEIRDFFPPRQSNREIRRIDCVRDRKIDGKRMALSIDSKTSCSVI